MLTASRLCRPSPFEAGARFALVVDDNPQTRDAVKQLLENRGYVVLAARDGAEAMECAPLFPFSLIITEIQMPGMDGFEVVNRIRALGGNFASLPIFACSAGSPPPDPETCQHLGFDRFFPKDGDLGPLKEAVERL